MSREKKGANEMRKRVENGGMDLESGNESDALKLRKRIRSYEKANQKLYEKRGLANIE